MRQSQQAQQGREWGVDYPKVAFIVALFVWGIAGIGDWRAFGFLHGVDLVIHEFGHPFFGLFGNEVLGALGGSIAQLAMPIAFTVYFLMQRELYSASVILFWVGQSVCDVAVYLRDAPTQALPLLGGDGVMHDWHFLLSHWGVLNRADAIADTMIAVAMFVFLAMVVTGIYSSLRTVTSPWLPR